MDLLVKFALYIIRVLLVPSKHVSSMFAIISIIPLDFRSGYTVNTNLVWPRRNVVSCCELARIASGAKYIGTAAQLEFPDTMTASACTELTPP